MVKGGRRLSFGASVLVRDARGTVGLGFSVTGSYQNFQSLMKDLAHSLRLIDIEASTLTASEKNDVYTYNVEIKTYWLK